MKRAILIAIGISCLGLCYAVYDWYDFSNGEAKTLESEKGKIQGDLTLKEGELKRLQNFKKNIELIKQELKELNIQLASALEYMPRTFELSKLLLKLTLIAQNSGVELNTFKPKKAEDKKEGTFYSTISVDFELKGTFTQTLVFLDQLSRLKRIVNVDAIKIRPIENNASKGGMIVTATQASIKTYRFSE